MTNNSHNVAALPAALFGLVPDPLTGESLAALLLFGQSGSLTAKAAVAALKNLCDSLTAADLQRLALGQPNPEAWTSEVVHAATAARRSLLAEQAQAATVLRDDAAVRKQLDGVAAMLMNSLREEVQELLKQASGMEEADRDLQQTLDGAGFSPDQVKTLVAARQGPGLWSPRVQEKREAAAVVKASADTLERYLSDPLRRPEVMGEGLLSKLAARVAAAAL